MGKYLNDAQILEKKIRDLSEHAGVTGYPLAQSPWNTLSKLRTRAYNSRNDKDDFQSIQIIIESLQPLMDKMKADWDEHLKGRAT